MSSPSPKSHRDDKEENGLGHASIPNSLNSSARDWGDYDNDSTRISLSGQVENEDARPQMMTPSLSQLSLEPPTRLENGHGRVDVMVDTTARRRLTNTSMTPAISFHPLSSIPEHSKPLRHAPSRLQSSRRQQSRRSLGGASIVQGPKRIRQSITPVITQQQHGSSNSFGGPRKLLDIENNKSMVITTEQFLDEGRYQELNEDGSLRGSNCFPMARSNSQFWIQQGASLERCLHSPHTMRYNSEIHTRLEKAWRAVLRFILVKTMDDVNALLLSRRLQVFLGFQTCYESYLLQQVVQALESPRRTDDLHLALKMAFDNRNTSRILVRSLERWDFWWHWYTQLLNSAWFDAWSQLPIVGFITSFPPTENRVATTNHALRSMFRTLFGEGKWLTRVITCGREGLQTDNPSATAQNLAAESNGFELANRNQYGTYVGRRKTNYFRKCHRLPVDESIVRTFSERPRSTMVNNGVVHVLRQLAHHWHGLLQESGGNFAHQRMEQLNPFETLRFHMPIVLQTLSSLRGRNRWDSQVLGPFVKKLQELKPSSTADTARALAVELQEVIAVPVCGGVASIVDPFYSWLESIETACTMVEEEAKCVEKEVLSVELGIQLGHDLITLVDWKIPTDRTMKNAISNYIRGVDATSPGIPVHCIRSALTLITPRDKRTLIELIQKGLARCKAAKLLLRRAKTLLQRELRRDRLNQAIRDLSKGDVIRHVKHGEWYWLEFESGENTAGVYIYDAKVTGQDQHRFLHADTKFETFVSLTDGGVKCRTYVPVGEAISRAQRAFMNIELDHGKWFSYDAFMEFTFLRPALQRLIVISQVTCDELDNTRLNVLSEVQRSNQVQVSIHDLEPGKTYYKYIPQQKEYVPFLCEKEYTASDPEWASLARTKIVRVPPQSIIQIGGGPSGLINAIHCTEAVLTSGGVMKIDEARDTFAMGGATFERAQIVRLDSRWIAMLRYHLGTGFEDVFIPASGETDAQLGNTLPKQGFVEITIKDLENMLQVEVSKMWSKGLLVVHTDSKSMYDEQSNSLAKYGQHLKIGDVILRRVNEEGHMGKSYHSWRVVDVKYIDSLGVDDLKIGDYYGVYIKRENAVLPYKFMGIDGSTETYTFMSLQSQKSFLKANKAAFPHVYPKGTKHHGEVSHLVIESVMKGTRGYIQQTLDMRVIKDKKFTLDIGHTHIVQATGKPHDSHVHFCVTTLEPYGVCCIQGLKISMGMHNFGEKRWGVGIVDDIRSRNDQNTRIVGDFTKMVRCAPVTKKMLEMIKEENWQLHFFHLIIDAGFPELNDTDPVVPKIQRACMELAQAVPTFRRQTLQTRFFETGDNYYLGMEFLREFNQWKNELVLDIVASLTMKVVDGTLNSKVVRLKETLKHHIDRLWYESVLEVIRTGDVYNPGARSRVPRLYLINSYSDERLGSLPAGESFRLSDSPAQKYEIVTKKSGQVIVRNVEGYISRMPKSTKVRREGNLTRGPDGNSESRVSLASFPVGHYVNLRTARLNNSEKGYLFAFIGDEQATPHFMRYSGLTGACINAMLFNNFIKQANNGVPFTDRFRLYSAETNWSNGEVVRRGTGGNYGEDGFLRPGFRYDHAMDYLYSKCVEFQESGQSFDNILSHDWTVKFAASLVPRGMELNEDFIQALLEQLHDCVFDKFVKEVKAAVKSDERIDGDALENLLNARGAATANDRESMDSESYFNEFLLGLNVDRQTKSLLEDPHIIIAKSLDHICHQIVDSARKEYLYNERISSESCNQPKPVDSIVDDFAVEAQTFANSLTQSAAFAAGALAFTLAHEQLAQIFGAILAGLNIAIAFDTMANVARYKIRNEEARIIFAQEKMLGVMKGVFSVMNRQQQDAVHIEQNPFVMILDRQVSIFVKAAKYYDFDEPFEFLKAYQKLVVNINDPNEIRLFQNLLATSFIVDVYHVNSYLQEYLVDIYKTLEDMNHLLSKRIDRTIGSNDAHNLFVRLSLFRRELRHSLQLGPTRFGFLKERRISQWDCSVVFKYFYSLICCSNRSGVAATAPISNRTLSVIRQARHLSGLHQSTILRREIRDLESLYWATRESDIASLVFMSAFLVFVTSIFFTIARIFRIEVLLNVAYWGTATSALVAILATFHLWRKFIILINLVSTLDKKIEAAALPDDADNIRKVRSVAKLQSLLTLVRLGAAGAAAVALPWSVAQNTYPISTNEDIPFYIALGAVCAAGAATVMFFVVEFRVRYNLNPNLGKFVCESFRDEIELMFRVLSVPTNNIDTIQVQERVTWEYVAREFLHRYRFDAVFAADRFGAILQYIQSGMDPRSV